MNPLKDSMAVLRQIVQLIPAKLIDKLADKYNVTAQSRSISPVSHVVAMIYAQLSHALGLNDVCDSLFNHKGTLSQIRNSTPPSRNGLSNANMTRDAGMAEELFWAVKKYLTDTFPTFVTDGRNYPGLPYRFKRTIHVVDSTTIKLIAYCMDWAKHRRRKAGAKIHLRLDMGSFLPVFALVSSANCNDAIKAHEVCAGVKSGEIVLFDKAYVDFKHLYSMLMRGVFWVTRAKTNMQYDTVGQHASVSGNIIRDERIILKNDDSRNDYPEKLRLVEAFVEIDKKIVQMIFITNNFKWAASSICDLYRCRWGIEVFFKEIKQTLQLADFLGNSENAVRWQIWTALLVYLLVRFIAWQKKWKHSFNRLFTIIKGVLWNFLDLFSVLECCGTAGVKKANKGSPKQRLLPGFR